MGLLRKLLRLPAAARLALLEAVVLLGLTRIALRLVRFPRLAAYLGLRGDETDRALGVADAERARLVRWGVEAAARRVPWEAACLARAVTAKLMLRRRAVATTLYLGVRSAGDRRIDAHAWLRAGEVIVTGEHDLTSFTVLSTFV